MNVPPCVTEKRLVYYRCRMGRRRLDRLIAVAVERIPDDAVVFSTQRGSTRYRQNALDALVQAIQQANGPNDPEVWADIMVEGADSLGSRGISLRVDQESVEIEVSGSDTTWVYGQEARLKEMLTAFDGTLAPNPAGRELFTASVITIYFTVLSLLSLAGVLGRSERGSTVVAGIYAVIGAGFCAWYWVKILATKQKWSVTGDVSAGSGLVK